MAEPRRESAPEPGSRWGAETGFDGIPRLALRVPEAAIALSLGERTVNRLIAEGRIRTVKLGGAKQAARLIPVAELERWLAETSAAEGGQGDV